jgi:G:T-mismatch repair DNA endonuclease (very short patch repair protein)
MKANSLRSLQGIISEVKRIDDKISEVDIHIGGLYQFIDKSRHGMPPILARKERTIIVEGCTYHERCYSRF